MTVPYTFGTATTSIPLSNLDANFNTPITLGNTSIYLGNTTTTIGNLTLTNATISSGNVTISNVTVTTANVTNITVSGTANIATGNITTLTSTSITNSGLTSGRVTFAGASGLLSDSANLTFSGTSLGVTGGISVNQNSAGTVAGFANSDTTNGYGVSIQAGGTAATRYALTVRNPAGNQDWLKVSSVTGEVGHSIFAPGTFPTSEIARFTPTGLGIGTSNPSTYLTVNNSANSGNTMTITGLTTATGAAELIATRTGTESSAQGQSANFTLGNTTASRYSSIQGYQGGFQFFGFNGSSWNEWARIDSSGNLGLGVTPTSGWTTNAKVAQIGARMAVYNDGSNNALFSNNMYFDGSNNRYIATAASARYYLSTDGSHIWNQAASGTAGNAITFTQAMTLDASNRLTVNGTTPYSTAAITAQETASLGNGIAIKNRNSTQTWVLTVDSISVDDKKLVFVDVAGGPTGRMTLYPNGDVEISGLAGVGSRAVTVDSAGVLSAVSDSSLKEEVTNAHIAGLAEIMQIHPKMYRWKNDIVNRGNNAAIELGFFANEVAPIIPSAAPKGKDGLYGFYDRSITAALVKSIQEQQALIESLTTRLTNLENK
jgi:hypothetical protein